MTFEFQDPSLVPLQHVMPRKMRPNVVEYVDQTIHRPCLSALQELVDDAGNSAGALHAVVRGRSDGGSWAAHKPAATPISDWASGTLLQLNAAESKKMSDLATIATEVFLFFRQ